MATFVDTPSTQAFGRQLSGEKLSGESYRQPEHHAGQRIRYTRRGRITALVCAALLAGLVGLGTYAIVHQHASYAPTQSPAVQTQSSASPAATIVPSKPNPEIPSGNNIGNMGTGGGPTHVNPQIPSGNNIGNMGTGGGPVR